MPTNTADMSSEKRGARSDASFHPAGKSVRPSELKSIFFVAIPFGPMRPKTSTENDVSRVAVLILPRMTLTERELSIHARWL
jgi:hypothetical protein